MIKLVGIKRIFILVVLIGINLLVAGSYLFGLDPMLQDAKTQVSAVDAQIAELSGKIANIKEEMAYLKENMPKYQETLDKGIFQNQDRFMIGRVLEEMGRKAALFGFSFVIDELKEVPNADAAGIGYRLVNSRVNIKIAAAPLDSSIYAFLQGIGDSFSGHTHVKGFDIKRIAEVKEQALKDIANGKPTGFLSANIVFDWMTMMQKAAEQPSTPTGAAGTGAPDGFRGR